MRGGTPDQEPRLGRVLRLLTERAEQEASEREQFARALAGLLAAPADFDLTALFEAVVGGAPSIDAAGVLEHGAGGYTVRYATGLVPSAGLLDPDRTLAGCLADAERTRLPQQAASLAEPLRPFPYGTRAALAIPLLDSRGDLLGLAVFGSRSAAELPGEAVLLARVAAERASRALERARLEAMLARAGDAERRASRLGGGLPIARAPADLGEVVRRTVDELAAAHRGTRVEVETRGDLSGSWDAARLEQVVSTLVSNAVDHGDEGAPVRVVAWGADDAVRLEVENRGEMPPAALARAFDGFQRGPEAHGRKASGLGPGLYVAREIVRRHGGDIAMSAEGGATRVEVRLPRGPHAEDECPGEGRSTGE